MDWEALRLSLKLASASTLMLLPVGLTLAFPMAYGRFRGKALLEAFTTLPLILPPTVLGFYLIVALGPRSPLGHAPGDGALVGHPDDQPPLALQ